LNRLEEGSCEACRMDAPMVSPDEMPGLLNALDGWELKQPEGVQQLEKAFSFPSFAAAMEFANRVGNAAETENHHPAMLLEWGKATVTWWSHKIGGLHMNDFIMAAKTDQLYRDQH
jgi:4a-hydroxytetrahydrobiopterin dehydratase